MAAQVTTRSRTSSGAEVAKIFLVESYKKAGPKVALRVSVETLGIA